MKNKKIGNQTVKLDNPPKIISTHSIVGPKEGEGPLSKYFDEILNDDMLGKESFEKAESEMMFTAISQALKKGNLKETDIDYLFS
jgi:stage V sporulation protein AD